MDQVNLLDLDRDGLTAYVESLGEKRFRATQLFRWIHQKGVAELDAMTDLARSLRDKLRGEIEMLAPGSLPNDGKVIEDARSYK